MFTLKHLVLTYRSSKLIKMTAGCLSYIANKFVLLAKMYVNGIKLMYECPYASHQLDHS